MDSSNANTETGCCPRFNPEPWDEKEITWEERLFVKDRVRSIFHIPVNFGQVMRRNMERISAAGAASPDMLLLSDEDSLWGADVYIAVTKEVPGTAMATISGTFLTKVFEGPFQNARKWCRQMQDYVASKGKTATKTYNYYTTCPKCAKHYGKNYVVLVAQV